MLAVKDLCIRFSSGRQVTEAVKRVNFTLEEGETLAIVGESGSGKSVTALALSGLLPLPPRCEISGSIQWEGVELLGLPPARLRHYRGKVISYIFQEPSSSLHPYFSIGHQIAEVVREHQPGARQVKKRVIDALDEVGIPEPKMRYDAYPWQLSGGMQQRVMIAMALASRCRLLVADEPTTALDSVTQAQILTLLKRIQREYPMAMLLITHNFGLVEDLSNRVLVMQEGHVLESGNTTSVLEKPSHPYTQKLLTQIPRLGDRNRDSLTANE
jgi:ABC-type dipeptide/oligopeptide/nickel transport system ATPase component